MLLVIMFWMNTVDMSWPGCRSVFGTSASLGQDVPKTSRSNNNNNQQDLEKRNLQKNKKKEKVKKIDSYISSFKKKYVEKKVTFCFFKWN